MRAARNDVDGTLARSDDVLRIAAHAGACSCYCLCDMRQALARGTCMCIRCECNQFKGE